MNWFQDHWREALDVIVGLATLAAAILAWSANVQTKRNSEALVRERRIDFLLGILANLLELNVGSSNVAMRDARMRALARLLPLELIPLTRSAIFGLGNAMSGPPGDALYAALGLQTQGQSRIDVAQADVETELVGVVQALLAERDAPQTRPRRWWNVFR